MSKEQTPITAEELAEVLHDLYEDLAIKNNWNTQENCKVHFNDLPEANKRTMIGLSKYVQKYANAKVLEERNKNKREFLEALEREIKKCVNYYGYDDVEQNVYYETEVKPKYD